MQASSNKFKTISLLQFYLIAIRETFSTPELVCVESSLVCDVDCYCWLSLSYISKQLSRSELVFTNLKAWVQVATVKGKVASIWLSHHSDCKIELRMVPSGFISRSSIFCIKDCTSLKFSTFPDLHSALITTLKQLTLTKSSFLLLPKNYVSSTTISCLSHLSWSVLEAYITFSFDKSII